MQTFELSKLQIDNQNIFQFANNLERYIFPLEIADEVFCNFVMKKSTKKFYDEIINPLMSSDSFNSRSEKKEIYALLYDLRFLESLKPDGKEIDKESFKNKISLFSSVYNYTTCAIQSKLSTLGRGFDTGDYFLSAENILKDCLEYGESKIYAIRRKSQEKLRDECALNVAKYFLYLCICEEISRIIGKDFNDDSIASQKSRWEFCVTFQHSKDLEPITKQVIDDLYKRYLEVCTDFDVSPKELEEFFNIYPEKMDDIFKYRMPIAFYENVYLSSSVQDSLIIQKRNLRLYSHCKEESGIYKDFEKYKDDFDNTEIFSDKLANVFYHFFVHGLYPPIFNFEYIFDDEGIVIKEKFFEDRKGKNILDLNVGKFFDVFEFKGFEIKEEKPIQKLDGTVLDRSVLFNKISRIENLIKEYEGKDFIPECDILRISNAIRLIKKDINEAFEKGISIDFYNDMEKSLSAMEGENRLIFSQYEAEFLKNGKMVEYSNSTKDENLIPDDLVAQYCEALPNQDDGIFNCSGKDISSEIDVKAIGLKEIIDKRYLIDLRQIREFVSKNSEDKELALLVRDSQKVLDIAEKAYQHDECLQSSFEWFQENEKKVIDGIEYFSHLNKVPSSYRIEA